MNSSTRLEYLSNRIKWGEDTLALVIFSAMALLPLIESFARLFNILSIPASQVIVQHFTLWIGFLGAVLAARQNKLLSLTHQPLFAKDEEFHFGKWVANVITFIVLLILAWGSWDLVKVEMQYPIDIAPNISRWVAQLIMPFGFLLMAFQIYINSYANQKHRITLIIMVRGFDSPYFMGPQTHDSWQTNMIEILT